MGEFCRKPLTLTLSPQAGRGDDLYCCDPSIFSKLRDDKRCAHTLRPVKTGRRWPTGRMRGSTALTIPTLPL